MKNMDALIDANVILNFTTGRDDPFRVSSEKVMYYAKEEFFRGFVAIHTLPTLWYILRKVKNVDETRLLIKKVCDILTVATISHGDVERAIDNNRFRDFEDCLQDECAHSIGAEYLITCNYKDFKNAKTKIVTPDDFLKIIEPEQESK